jgi:hypothetical protein
MGNSILWSTLLLTVLLLIGLGFFIRASVKDRTQAVTLIAEESEESVLRQLQQYFSQRAYRIAAVDEARHQITFEGIIRPSVFLAIFLTILAAIGLLCLTLVLWMLYPQVSGGWLGLVLLSPIAGAFYWRGAERCEEVLLQVESAGDSTEHIHRVITITAHRDELEALQRKLPWKAAD